MPICLRTALMRTLAPHLGLSQSRLETACLFLVALIQGRTVNLTHVASQFPGPARYASKYRRLQRFFQVVRFDQTVVAALVVRMLNLSRPKCLALDRTHWKIGRRDINILVLAIVTRRFRVPLLWSVLTHPGNSTSAQRMALMRRYLARFGPDTIELLLADREFIGADWIKFLIDHDIPFAIRVKEDLRLALADRQLWSIRTLLRTKRARHLIHTVDVFLPDHPTPLRLAARRIKSGQWLVVLTNRTDPRRALQTYRRRWAIECLFAEAKTRGFNLEDTHLADPGKIETLTALLALTITWVYATASRTMGLKAIPRKVHGRRAKSWFRTGLDTLRQALFNTPHIAANAWTAKCPIRLKAT
ncbi:IS4 family transposase [Microvirga sp. M2]|uniref:IS4 family transposase n=1 Tax=Microvirga sp. M2 TaxID=3073270 RepID=UPI0039C2F7D6